MSYFFNYSFAKFLDERTQRYKSKYAQTDNIIKILKNVPGKILFKYQQKRNGRHTFRIKNDKLITVNSLT